MLVALYDGHVLNGRPIRVHLDKFAPPMAPSLPTSPPPPNSGGPMMAMGALSGATGPGMAGIPVMPPNSNRGQAPDFSAVALHQHLFNFSGMNPHASQLVRMPGAPFGYPMMEKAFSGMSLPPHPMQHHQGLMQAPPPPSQQQQSPNPGGAASGSNQAPQNMAANPGGLLGFHFGMAAAAAANQHHHHQNQYAMGMGLGGANPGLMMTSSAQGSGGSTEDGVQVYVGNVNFISS